jgi:TonB family protein
MPRPLEHSNALLHASDADHLRQQREFRANLVLTAFVHLVGLLGFFLAAHFQPKSKVESILWLDGGLAGGGEPAPSSATPDPEPEPDPIPESHKPEPAPTPTPEPVIPSEISQPKPTPAPTPKPATPRAATPKPETPRATPKATPKKTATPKPKASPSPTTPKPAADEAKASPAPTPAKDKGDESGAKSSNVKTSGKGSGEMIGEGKGKDAAGSGAGAGKPSDFGWYFSLLRDKYYAVWSPPALPDSASFVATLKIRVKRDGSVLGYDLIKSSGNSLMDGSVLEAARQVTQIDPLPSGLGKENIVEIPVNFKPD